MEIIPTQVHTPLMTDQTMAARLREVFRLWGLTGVEAAELFGIAADQFQRWLREGVPQTHASTVSLLAAATDELQRRTREG